MRLIIAVVATLPLCINMPMVHAQDLASEVAELRTLLTEIQRDYETRIRDLEIRLARAEQIASGARQEAAEAFEIAEESVIAQGKPQPEPEREQKGPEGQLRLKPNKGQMPPASPP